MASDITPYTRKLLGLSRLQAAVVNWAFRKHVITIVGYNIVIEVKTHGKS